MSHAYFARVHWQRQPDEAFSDNKYSRLHHWTFDEGVSIPASSSVHSVPLPYSSLAAVDPEEALVAAVSSCHMLWFLGLAAKKRWVIESYDDHPQGTMGKNSHGKMAITEIVLKPKIVFSGSHQPSEDEIAKNHEQAHENCYIAHSILATVTVDGENHYAG
ncbi:OsmC family peroxiredoxin [Alcaligenaceae bacterium 429]|nr:OsmC family peroxiredoxin [Alcaligenaceae bacterium 429]